MEPQSDEVGAFVTDPRTLLAAESDSLLNGLRPAVKDLIDIVGYPTMCGNPDRTVSHFALVAPAPMGTVILRARRGADLPRAAPGSPPCSPPPCSLPPCSLPAEGPAK